MNGAKASDGLERASSAPLSEYAPICRSPFGSPFQVHTFKSSQVKCNSSLEALTMENGIAYLEALVELPSLENVVCIMQICRKEKNLANARRVQAHICSNGLEACSAFGNYLVPMFVECGSMSDAKEAFCKLSHRKEYSWTSLVQGYVECGESWHALNLLQKMREDCVQPTAYTLQALVKACARLNCVEIGQEMHSEIAREGFEIDPFVGNTLVVMYAKCGSLAEAQEVFDKLPVRDVIAWNALVTGYADLGLGQEVLQCMKQMHAEGIPPNTITFACSLKAYGSIGAIDEGRRVHSQLVIEGLEQEILLGSTLVDMYVKCGLLVEAQQVFDEMPSRGVVAWTALISGYAEHGLGREALNYLEQMQLEGVMPDSVTCVCSLKACMRIEAIDKGREIHTDIVREGFEVDHSAGNALVDMYAKCGLVVEARDVLDELLDPGVVSWNSLISGYAELGLGQEALDCLQEMQANGVLLNEVTMLCSLKACALVGAIDMGRKFHAKVVEEGLETDLLLGNTVMDVYAKSGSLAEAHEMFNELPTRDVVSWNTMIAGYSRQGESEAAFNLFDRMRKDGVRPDEFTFLSVLTLCSHAGLVNKGLKYYNAMCEEYGIIMTVKHHNCMIDLLGRAGQITEAMAILEKTPFQPNLVTWKILLSACWKWGNVELGRRAFEHAVRSNIKHAALFIMMYNLYADAHMWEDAKKIEVMRMGVETGEELAKSWIENCGITHTFVEGTTRHPLLTDLLDTKLKEISDKIAESRYMPHVDHILHHFSTNAKECGQTEKLAVACGLIYSPHRASIYVVKNVWICQDCHLAIALISKLEQRTIICRDACRFHAFKGGKCSCEGCWQVNLARDQNSLVNLIAPRIT